MSRSPPFLRDRDNTQFLIETKFNEKSLEYVIEDNYCRVLSGLRTFPEIQVGTLLPLKRFSRLHSGERQFRLQIITQFMKAKLLLKMKAII